jgi:hypothetical protein
MWEGILLGAGVAGLNGALLWIFLRRALASQGQTFALAVLGGMGVRLLLVLALSAAVIKLTQANLVAYLSSLLLCYFALQIVEIAVVLRRRNQERRAAMGENRDEKSREKGCYRV